MRIAGIGAPAAGEGGKAMWPGSTRVSPLDVTLGYERGARSQMTRSGGEGALGRRGRMARCSGKVQPKRTAARRINVVTTSGLC